MTRRSASGSSRSASSEDPVTSAKTIVTLLRIARAAWISTASGAPQARQNRAISGFACAHGVQTGMTPVYDARLSPSSALAAGGDGHDAALFERRLSGGQPRERDPVGRAGDVVEAQLVAEGDRV